MHQQRFNSSVFNEIADTLGEAKAAELCRHLGGVKIYVPQTIDANHPIAKAIGMEAAQTLAYYHHRTAFTLPKSYNRRARVLELWERGGMSQKEIALATEYSERHVGTIIAQHNAAIDDGQLDLFE